VSAQDFVQDFIDWEYSEQKARFENRDWISKYGEDALDQHALIDAADRNVVDVVVRRTEAMLARVKSLPNAPDLTAQETQLTTFKSDYGPKAGSMSETEEKNFFNQIISIRRQIALANPLLDGINDILFVEYELCPFPPKGYTNGTHIVAHNFGSTSRGIAGNGLYILNNFRSNNPQVVNILENSTVQNGRMKGMSLTGGGFFSPDLSWDGKKVVFSWTTGGCADGTGGHRFDTASSYHIFQVNIDGSNLEMLTDGAHNDTDPVYLPNGRIAFISSRRGGAGRCHGNWMPTYTLHSMKPDGSDLICLSFHETNEWQPSVNNDGMIVYTRWDYIDRADCIAHHLWLCYPDGRDPRAPHGNYPLPFTTVTGTKWPDGRALRPDAEMHIRAIPNTGKYIATAGPHHGTHYGSLILIDPAVVDDGKMSQIRRITPEQPFPEHEVNGMRSYKQYGMPWPLSEDFYLSNYRTHIVVMDRFGNRDVLFTTPERYDRDAEGEGGRGIWGFRPTDPIPVVPRKLPPVIPTATYQGERLTEQSPNATIFVNNVHITDEFGKLPDGVEIKKMRIVQLFPKTTGKKDIPLISPGFDESMARMSLGTVPVEADGSVYCLAPVNKEIYFQLLDEKDMAVQSMRSGTYVHPGEQMSCVGCHESKWEAPQITANPLALQRDPSPLTPEPGGVTPISFQHLIKPLFDAHCTNCHQQQGGPDMVRDTLTEYLWGFSGSQKDHFQLPLIGGSRSVPGKLGANMAKLYTGGYLSQSHYNVNLTREELHTITMWLDLNSNDLSYYKKNWDLDPDELQWPLMDVDPDYPQGVETRNVEPVRTLHYHEDYPVMAVSIRGTTARLRFPSSESYHVQVHDMSGNRIAEYRTGGTDSFSFSVKTYRPGIYFLKVTGQEIQLNGMMALMN
jgi:hypothetical protein